LSRNNWGYEFKPGPTKKAVVWQVKRKRVFTTGSCQGGGCPEVKKDNKNYLENWVLPRRQWCSKFKTESESSRKTVDLEAHSIKYMNTQNFLLYLATPL